MLRFKLIASATCILASALLTVTVPIRAASAPPFSPSRPQYLFLNRAPGPSWYQNNPQTVTDKLFEEPFEKLGHAHSAGRRLGLSFVFSYLDGPPAQMHETLSKLLTMAQKHDVPILIGLSGENWWDYRSDLWNWWDAAKPGYNPANAANVEWTSWTADSALKIAWRNWGSQIRVSPPPNLVSPAFLNACNAELTAMLRIIKSWADSLPAERAYLFPGVKVGWETSIGINAFCYPDGDQLLKSGPADGSGDPKNGLDMAKGLSGGQLLQGYAAATTMGLKHPGPVTLEDQEQIVTRYVRFITDICRKEGLFPDQIFTHGGGQYPPWDQHLSYKIAINSISTPGWSLYNLSPERAGDLAHQLTVANTRDWCASEWLTFGTDSIQWEAAIENTLSFRRCRFLSVYNWEGVRDNASAVEGLRRALAAEPKQ